MGNFYPILFHLKEKHMDPLDNILYDKKFICAHCQHSFASKKVRLRRGRPYRRDPDFCEHYENHVENPTLYHVVVCPECGYSSNESFRKEVPPQIEHLIEEKIAANWTKKDYTGARNIPEAIATYKLAIFTAGVRKETHCVLAGLCLRLAWLYRYQKKQTEEERFLRLALGEYEESYQTADYIKSGMSELMILYLLGELHHQLNDPGEALQYFSKVVEHPLKANDPQMVRLARDQWQTMREDMKKQRGAEQDHAG
jgi:uncharacterized protein (DUF2225 family)